MPGDLSTHILDTAKGRPAGGVKVRLLSQTSNGWTPISQLVTNIDGRIPEFVPPDSLKLGMYKLLFETQPYFRQQGIVSFFHHVEIVFSVDDEKQHYHVPLLISPASYSTYRGS